MILKLTNTKQGQELFVKWLSNQRMFLAPLGVLYIGFVIARLQETGVTWTSFVPTNGEVTALVLYALNAAYDYLLKIKQVNQ